MTRCLTALSAAVVAALVAASCGTSSPTRPSDSRPSSTVSILPPVASSNSTTVEWRCVARVSDRAFYGIFSAAQVACMEPAGRPISASGLRAAAVPDAPISLSSSVSGSTVVLSWSASGAASSYVVEAGSSPGLADLANIDTGSGAPTLTATGVPAGTYYVRVRGRNSEGLSGPSNETVVVVGGGGGCGGVPGAPTELVATSSGSNVSLVWGPPAGGCGPQSYYIEAGSSPGRNDLADFSTGNAGTVFTAGGIGNGTYYVRVRAWTPAGKSAPSNEATLVVGGGGSGPCAAPAAPNISDPIAGTSVTIAWATPAGSPSSYTLEVGRSPGAADVGTASTASTSVSFAPGPGTFYARVRLVNACGTSGPSNEVTFAFGGLTPPGGTPPRAVFTIISNDSTYPNACVVSAGTGADAGYNVLRCNFDGSASTGNPTTYEWTSPALNLTFSGAVVREPRLGPCGRYPGEVTTNLTLTVTSSAGSHSTTQELSIAKGGNCG